MDPYLQASFVIAVLAAVYLILIMFARWWQDRRRDES